MEMRVMVQLLAPGVEHGEAADLRAEMLRIPSNVLECLGDGAKEQAIEWVRVLEHQRPQIVWQGKDDMGVGRLEYLALPGREPRGLGRAMAFGAAPVAAGVIRLHFVPTVVALGDMSAQSGRATQRDRAQCPVLRPREGVPIALEKDVAMLAHHIGHFQWRATHGRVSRPAGKTRASRGLSVAVSAGCATWR